MTFTLKATRYTLQIVISVSINHALVVIGEGQKVPPENWYVFGLVRNKLIWVAS